MKVREGVFLLSYFRLPPCSRHCLCSFGAVRTLNPISKLMPASHAWAKVYIMMLHMHAQGPKPTTILPPLSHSCPTGVMVTLRMRLRCEIFREGRSEPVQVRGAAILTRWTLQPRLIQ